MGAGLLLVHGATATPPLTIKLGTLAPPNTPCDGALRRISADSARISDNAIELKIFPGGIVGNEPDMVRKMRVGQLGAAAISIDGLSRIFSGVLAVSYPLLVSTEDQFRAMFDHMQPYLGAELEERGFVPIVWIHIGWMHFFSSHPVESVEHLQNHELSIWDAQPALVRAWQQASFNIVTIPVTEAMMGLQSGFITAYLSTPLSAAAFQWFALTPYMNDLQFAPMYGAIVVTKRIWDRVPADLKPQMLESARAAGRNLSENSRQLDAQAVAVMKQFGLTVISWQKQFRSDWEDIAQSISAQLVEANIIDKDAFDRVQEVVRMHATSSD